MATEDKSLMEFLQAFDERKKKEQGRAQMEMQAIEKKRAALLPLREFLQKFVDLGLIVMDTSAGTPGVAMNATKSFSFYETESSPTWGPGVSLFFDHPAEVEIAIPNDSKREAVGAVVIRSVTNHRDLLMLHQKFTTVPLAKAGLAKFLGKNAVSIENDPRRRTASTGGADSMVLKTAPQRPPEDE